jgi:hypothetical protein
LVSELVIRACSQSGFIGLQIALCEQALRHLIEKDSFFAAWAAGTGGKFFPGRIRQRAK